MSEKQHDSDCALHNEPALPAGPCDCRVSLLEAARPLIVWLNENANPHATAIVTTTSVELLFGQAHMETHDHVKG